MLPATAWAVMQPSSLEGQGEQLEKGGIEPGVEFLHAVTVQLQKGREIEADGKELGATGYNQSPSLPLNRLQGSVQLIDQFKINGFGQAIVESDQRDLTGLFLDDGLHRRSEQGTIEQFGNPQRDDRDISDDQQSDEHDNHEGRRTTEYVPEGQPGDAAGHEQVQTHRRGDHPDFHVDGHDDPEVDGVDAQFEHNGQKQRGQDQDG